MTDHTLPLYCQYPRQHEPQCSYLWITEDASGWDYAGGIGNAVPADEYHGLTQTIPCSPYLTQTEIDALTARLAPLVARVQRGLSSEWDGSNHVGTLTDDASEALDQLEAVLDPTDAEPSVWICEAAECLGGADLDTLWPDRTVSAATRAAELVAEAAAESPQPGVVGVILDADDVETYLVERAAREEVTS